MQHQEIKEIFLVFDIQYDTLGKAFSSLQKAEAWIKEACDFKKFPQGFYIVTRKLDSEDLK